MCLLSPIQVLIGAKTISLKLLLEGEWVLSVEKLEAKQGPFTVSGKLKPTYGSIKTIEIRRKHVLPTFLLPEHAHADSPEQLQPHPLSVDKRTKRCWQISDMITSQR